jgi:hypothetical protein
VISTQLLEGKYTARDIARTFCPFKKNYFNMKYENLLFCEKNSSEEPHLFLTKRTITLSRIKTFSCYVEYVNRVKKSLDFI